MEPVATHCPVVPGQIDSLFASSSRAGPVSDDVVAAASAEGQSDPPIHGEGKTEEDPQATRLLEALSVSKLEAKEQTAAGLPGFDDMPELASMKAATKVRQALGSPAAQVEHRAEIADAPTSVGGITQEIHRAAIDDRAKVPASPSPGVIEEHAATEEAPSPASSSADAPGSDYDDPDERDPLDMPSVPRKEETPSMPPPLHAAESVSNIAEANERKSFAGDNADNIHTQQNVATSLASEILHATDPTLVQLSQNAEANASEGQEATGPVFNKTGEAQDREGWSLRISALLSEIEGRSAAATTVDETPTQTADNQTSEASTADQTRPAGGISTEQSAKPDPPTRSLEGEGGSSTKRQRLDDAGTALELAAFAQGSTAPEPNKKPPAKKADKPPTKAKAPPKLKAPPKPKAALKPKKEPKEKAQKALEEQKLETEALNPDLDSTLHSTSGPDPRSNSPAEPPLSDESSPEQGAASAAKESEAKPKKTRKLPARPRKQPAKSADVPDEGIQTPPARFQAPALDPMVQQAASLPAANQGEGPEAGTAEQALKGKGKAKVKPKAPSKAKGTGNANTAGVPQLNMPSKTAATSVTVADPPKKAAPKRAPARKGKGPVAKLLPAQADGAVSELELDPSQTQNEQTVDTTSFRAESGSLRDDETVSDAASYRAAMRSEFGGPPSEQGGTLLSDQQRPATPPAPITSSYGGGGYPSSNIFTSMPPPLYPAQAYYPTRAEINRQHNRGLSSLTSAASMLDPDMQWSESSVVRAGSASSEYESVNEATSPTTVANTTGSMAGDAASDATSLSPDQSMSMMELDPRIYPSGWRLPNFDLMDPDRLMTTMRERTVWTFWDCYLPLGCRDQDMVLLSNDGIAFPCAAWNPCLFSTMLKRVIKNPSRAIRHIMQRGVDENRRLLGYAPLPCIWIDENWHATNLLLSFLHPIPSLFLPDRATCRVVLDLGMRYGVDRAISAATQRLHQLDEEDRATKAKGKGKGRSTEEEIAADLAQRAAEEMRD
ncbi:uncharacterized protein UTRI_05866 [Ustilago trichophora]|uniref:Uncharacterized protein n=1 Tax=Ustilago trichophora TaxID=86804 RepID=A0A5C3EJX9_9BASI|nr:uncharacterized protein UTRI_05866 [Ustilago trichophora]